MAGRDLVGIAQTGTGKTAAFALPILHYLATNQRAAPRNGCRVLVLSPTRELASQIAESFRSLGAGLRLTTAEIFVLDEADRMLDLGFVKAIRRIAGALPKRRQNLFFSATMPAEIAALAG